MSECVNPSELEPGALMSFIDGEANEQVQAHLARCPHCAAQAMAYRRTEALLQARLHRLSCPAPEQLGLYQLNLLSANERLIMSKHVRECPHCRNDLDELSRVSDRPSLLDRLRQAVGVVEALPLPVPRQRAIVLRGAAPPLERFRTDALDVYLSLQPGHSRGRRTVMGRLLPRDEAAAPGPGLEIWLMRDEQAWATAVEAGGVFTFEEVEPGEYDLGLEWEGQAVLIRGVTVA
jgi:anti-sigma factor RsiW